MSAIILGRTLIGERAWDVMRAIDVLSYFKELDLEKIVITGNSGGGTASFYSACLEELIGEKDELMSIGEPFGLWVVEKKGNIAEYIKEGVHNIEVVLTDNIGYYKKRKVRVLNGSHTNLVPTALMLGAVTVYDCMVDEKLSAFVIINDSVEMRGKGFTAWEKEL